MRLFNTSQMAQIKAAADKSKQALEPPKKRSNTRSINATLNEISQQVLEYFKDSEAILITTKQQLHDYITGCIEAVYVGIDCEATGLDRIKDHVVGFSLYYEGAPECYIPNMHLVPIFDKPYNDQLSYEDCKEELKRLLEHNVRLVFANADYDLAMFHKDFVVDLSPIFYYDVILAWRCLKENEKDNRLKILYNKYVLKGTGDPKTFSDLFPVDLFPYCKPEIAKLYAANDAKITLKLFWWQLPYTDKANEKCKKNHLESIADLIWNVEFPLVSICHRLHYDGIYLDSYVADAIRTRYADKYEVEIEKLHTLVQEAIDNSSYMPSFQEKIPFSTGAEFNPDSNPMMKHLLINILGLQQFKTKGTGKDEISELNLPVIDEVLAVRSLKTVRGTFTDKLPLSMAPDNRIHAQFKQIGADTGRFSSADPNMQNIPSHLTDIRHMFRATPGYVMLSSDYSAQEPRLTAYVGSEEKMIKAFQENRDVYATIASVAFNVPYEQCLEFHPETHEYQPDGKERRGQAKTILLGVTYGRKIPSIAEQLFGRNKDMSDEEKIKRAQAVFDAVMVNFPGIRDLMNYSEAFAKKYGYVETILGRRRHIPEMQLPEFEFRPMEGYVNPDVDPLDIDTLQNNDQIPQRVQEQLLKQFKGYKYFGQIVKHTKELAEKQKIRVINNRAKIEDGRRQCLNSRIQGSAADQTKLAMLMIENNEEWKKLGGRILVPVHDELIAEVPIDKWEEGGELLSKLMCEAANFLPFESKCDVETTLRWYGLPYPCPFKKPKSLSDISEESISWLQYCLTECEYLMPVIKNEDGSKPSGIASRGINGQDSKELRDAIQDYMNRWRVNEDHFLDHIEQVVFDGVVPTLAK